MLQNTIFVILLANTVKCQFEPLILTDFIEKNQISEAKQKCDVKYSEFANVKSCAGYFRVDKTFDSNLFFWFFEGENYEEAPLVLWLQGGPGDWGFLGVFYENGPFALTKDMNLLQNPYSWTKIASVIYVDNPVGTGFSYTNPEGFSKNQTKIGEHLYEALTQFFTIFPEFLKNDFFICGESYGAKYTMALGNKIHEENSKSSLKINLKGISAGNGVVDPENEIYYSDYYYQIGLIDYHAWEKIRHLEFLAAENARKKNYTAALIFMSDAVFATTSIFSESSGFGGHTFYNLLCWNFTVNYTDIRKFVEKSDVRKALHVGNRTFHDRTEVSQNLLDETMVSVAPWMEQLLEHYRILIYNGQLDIIVPYPVTVNYLRNLKFRGAEDYKIAKRYQWWVDGDLAGYVKKGGNLTEVLVRNAGHMTIHEKPAWLFELFQKFFGNKRIV